MSPAPPFPSCVASREEGMPTPGMRGQVQGVGGGGGSLGRPRAGYGETSFAPSPTAAQGMVERGWARLANVPPPCLRGAEQWDAEMNKTLPLLSRGSRPDWGDKPGIRDRLSGSGDNRSRRQRSYERNVLGAEGLCARARWWGWGWNVSGGGDAGAGLEAPEDVGG